MSNLKGDQGRRQVLLIGIPLLIVAFGLGYLVGNLKHVATERASVVPPHSHEDLPKTLAAENYQKAKKTLYKWKYAELKTMDPTNRESIEMVINGYRTLEADFPGTRHASAAAEWRLDLEKMLNKQAE